MRRVVVALVLAALSLSCHRGFGERDVPIPALAPDVFVRLERTPCYGWCPSYVVTVHRDGRVDYEGRAWVKEIGQRAATLPRETFAKVEAFLTTNRFWELEDAYLRAGATDCPTVIVSAARAGASPKTVRHYTGDGDAPTRLVDVEDGLDALLGTERWIGTSEERDRLRRDARPLEMECPEPTLAPDVVARLDREAGDLGPDPAYTVTVFEDGRIRYDGRGNVCTVGRREARASPRQMKDLQRLFETSAFWHLDNAYLADRITCRPWVVVSWRRNGRTKTVRHYEGDEEAPVRLVDLERRLDELLETERWVGTEPEREALLKR
ncbi:MAG: hypothetical protein HYR85_01635 [Planctomycetes bacterium]|nr:hypothetical protein [Planctomycetota bacterium]MBI3845968.1 hypothetical protein [Planctomycetota bacterium]